MIPRTLVRIPLSWSLLTSVGLLLTRFLQKHSKSSECRSWVHTARGESLWLQKHREGVRGLQLSFNPSTWTSQKGFIVYKLLCFSRTGHIISILTFKFFTWKAPPSLLYGLFSVQSCKQKRWHIWYFHLVCTPSVKGSLGNISGAFLFK